MTTDQQCDFIRRVLYLTAKYDCREDLWWGTKGEEVFFSSNKEGNENDPLIFTIICNDMFYLASADYEDLTPENIDVFEQACKDIEALNLEPIKFHFYAGVLFCARVRKLRPLNRIYQTLPSKLAELLDACGPERDVDGTPRPPLKAMDEWLAKIPPLPKTKQSLWKKLTGWMS